MVKKMKEKKWMEVSCVFQNRPLSSWSRGKVLKKGSWGLQKVSLFIKL